MPGSSSRPRSAAAGSEQDLLHLYLAAAAGVLERGYAVAIREVHVGAGREQVLDDLVVGPRRAEAIGDVGGVGFQIGGEAGETFQ